MDSPKTVGHTYTVFHFIDSHNNELTVTVGSEYDIVKVFGLYTQHGELIDINTEAMHIAKHVKQYGIRTYKSVNNAVTVVLPI